MTANKVVPSPKSVISDLSTTVNIALFLTAFFLLRYIPLPTSSETLAWLFVAQAEPSPAWVLAILLHENVYHLLANLGQLLYFGIVPERRLSTIEYLFFLFVTGILTVLVQVAQYNLNGVSGGIAGASGATMAVMGFTVANIGLYYLGHTDDAGVSNFRVTLFGVGAFWAITQTISDFYPGWTLAPGASGVAHLAGFLVGAGYAVLKTSQKYSI